jgi:GT2 family glycosyltransferase
LRLDAVREVGYYDEYPSFYGSEEKDICIKFMDRGKKIIFMPGVHIWHDKINLSRDEKVKYRSVVCNDLVFLYRRSPAVALVPAVVFAMVSHLRFSIFYKKGVLFLPGIKGILSFLGRFFTLQRNPVKMSTFRKYYALNNKRREK